MIVVLKCMELEDKKLNPWNPFRDDTFCKFITPTLISWYLIGNCNFLHT